MWIKILLPFFFYVFVSLLMLCTSGRQDFRVLGRAAHVRHLVLHLFFSAHVPLCPPFRSFHQLTCDSKSHISPVFIRLMGGLLAILAPPISSSSLSHSRLISTTHLCVSKKQWAPQTGVDSLTSLSLSQACMLPSVFPQSETFTHGTCCVVIWLLDTCQAFFLSSKCAFSLLELNKFLSGSSHCTFTST